jgi:TPR repeat protein
MDKMVELSRNAVLISNLAVRPESLLAQDAGVAYENGAGVPRDHATAMKWLTKATEWGDAAASRELGRIYELGLGEPASIPTALRY